MGNMGIRGGVTDSFKAVSRLNNGNIYAVMLTEMVSNIFKEGMWFKALNPYMLILTDDPVQVGNMMTLNGVTRAVVGVASGRLAINTYGVDAVWVVSGFVGMLGILTNVVCLCKGSVPAAYFLNFIWAVYNGLWNSCLETSWARSILKSKREDVNGARQITNKVTTSMGPLFSAAIFMACGNTWSIELVTNVMLFGTLMTMLTVLLCFCFRSTQEIEQDMSLQGVHRLVFRDPTIDGGLREIRIEELCKKDFEENDSGIVWMTYPLGADSEDRWYSRISVVTRDFKESKFILVNQFHATFTGLDPDERNCIVFFEDSSRLEEHVRIHQIHVFLTVDEDLSVNRAVSRIHFSLLPLETTPPAFTCCGAMWKIVFGRNRKRPNHTRKEQLQESLLPFCTPMPAAEAGGVVQGKSKPKFAQDEDATPNMLGANVIVVCDVLNALGAGFSLKFMDLFLKVDYGVSPAGVFVVAFLQNIFGGILTPYAKALLANMRKRGYRAKLGVVLLWTLALMFLGILCIPGMPLWLVIVSIVMMQSLNSCTRAYNRAQLINYLPREKIASYMAWDALNKANQGGVAFFGAQVVALGGYRACFIGTFIILSIRCCIYLAFTLRKGTVKRGGRLEKSKSGRWDFAQSVSTKSSEQEITAEDMERTENIRPTGYDGEEESQLFQPSQTMAGLPDTDRSQERFLQVADIGDVTSSRHNSKASCREDAQLLLPSTSGRS
mmetsp:Transcript_52323/g.150780  ORF Transcript_52323/g.150780 Transcript_52323/m.150780 type:complete len:722 (-) Transcript_52323:292-2457(-)